MNITDPFSGNWHIVDNVADIPSPALLVYPDRIEKNILKMISVAGDVNRLRPHVKTYKMAEVVKLQMRYGIKKFKCATIAEAELVARCGAEDIMLAYQPVGPNQERFFALKKMFPGKTISCIADSVDIIMQLSAKAVIAKETAQIWIDINNGMNRTGITPGEEAENLFKMINELPGLSPAGLHVYDGHLRNPDPDLRKKDSDEAFEPVRLLRKRLTDMGMNPVEVVAGGTPTFPCHAQRPGVELSPGTLLLWDFGYSSSFPDMDFFHAAVLLARVISKPAAGIICIDLGHKAVASEMAQPRIKIAGIENYTITGHNEEHMVIRTEESGKFKTGDHIYALPYHICPTVDRYETVSVVMDGSATGEWKVEARKRKISI